MEGVADYVYVKQERNNKTETWADVLIHSVFSHAQKNKLL